MTGLLGFIGLLFMIVVTIYAFTIHRAFGAIMAACVLIIVIVLASEGGKGGGSTGGGYDYKKHYGVGHHHGHGG